MAELVAQFIREILIVFPGAFIRWVFLRPEKSFGEFLNDESIYNYLLSFLIIGLVIWLLIVLI